MDKEKRNRIQNFSNNGIETLVTLVEKAKNVLECKKTDAVSSKIKDAEWEKLEQVFNSQNSVLRTANQLKSKWESLKKVTKKDYSEEKLNLCKTGGGKFSNKEKPPWADRILNIIKIGAMGLYSKYDSDTQADINNLADINISSSSTATIINESTPVILEEDIPEIENDWENWTPETLRKTPHPSLRPFKKQINNNPQITSLQETTTLLPEASSDSIQNTASKPYTTPRKRFKRSSLAATTNQNFSDLALKKMELVILQLENTKQLHEFQMKQESELFELKKELLLTKIELNKKKLLVT